MIGLIGKKVGMTQIFDEDGTVTPVTVIEIKPNTVVGHKTQENNGYEAIVLGYSELRKNHITKPIAGQYSEGITPKKYVKEFRTMEGEYTLGQEVSVDLFKDIEYVDITGTSKGKGFQGVMKRHNYGGGPASHGSKFHRDLGSSGAVKPARTWKGTKMAGRMGNEQKTVQNLEIMSIDIENSALLVRGAVPGRKNGLVIVNKAKKK